MQNKGMYIIIIIAVVVILAVRIFLSSQQTETADALRGTAESLKATIDVQASQIDYLYSTATRHTEIQITVPPTDATKTPNYGIPAVSNTPRGINPPTRTSTPIPSSLNPNIQNAENSDWVIGSISYLGDYFYPSEEDELMISDTASLDFAISPDGSEIMSGNWLAELFIYSVDTGQKTVIPSEPAGLTAAAWSSDGQFIAFAGSNHLTIRNTKTSEEVLSQSVSAYIDQLAWSPDNAYVAAIGSDTIGSINLYVWSSPSFIQILKQSLSTKLTSDKIQTLSWLPSPRIMAIAVKDGVRVYTIDRYETDVLIPNTQNTTAIAWSPSGSLFATVEDKARIRIQRSGTGQIEHSLAGHQGDIRSIAWSPNSLYLASASEDKTVRIWNTETGELLYVLEHNGIVTRVKWSPDGSFLATGGSTKITLWDLPIDTSSND